MMKCEKCGGEIDPHDTGWAQWIEGWAENRRAGGTNNVVGAVRKQRFMCKECMIRVKSFGTEQESLL